MKDEELDKMHDHRYLNNLDYYTNRRSDLYNILVKKSKNIISENYWFLIRIINRTVEILCAGCRP